MNKTKQMRKIILAIFAPLLIASCVQKPTTVETEVKNVETTPVLSFEKAEWEDSVGFSESCYAKVTIGCEYPSEGSQELIDSINKWIIQRVILLSVGYAENPNEADSLINVALASKPSMPDFIRECGKRMLDSDSVDVAERYRLAQEEGSFEAPNEQECFITKAYEDSACVTLVYKGYGYLGGAHGSTMFEGATFSKEDGHRMDWELTKNYSKAELNDSIKAGVKAYFGVKTDQELINELQIGVMEGEWDGNMPLPAAPPYLSEKGIEIIYQQYEIACYAAGMPCCTLKKR